MVASKLSQLLNELRIEIDFNVRIQRNSIAHMSNKPFNANEDLADRSAVKEAPIDISAAGDPYFRFSVDVDASAFGTDMFALNIEIDLTDESANVPAVIEGFKAGMKKSFDSVKDWTAAQTEKAGKFFTELFVQIAAEAKRLFDAAKKWMAEVGKKGKKASDWPPFLFIT